MSSETALIYGYLGQDGRLLTKSLLDKGVSVVGIGRETTEFFSPGTEETEVHHARLPDEQLLAEVLPSEIYYLAANHSSSESDHSSVLSSDAFTKYFLSNIDPYISVLEAASNQQLRSPIFFASSAQVFGPESGEILSEKSPYFPSSLYGMAKAQATWLGRKYQEEQELNVFTGILFNHESPLRPKTFLTQRVIQTALRISEGSSERLVIGNLDAMVDWSLASDFVEGFQKLLKTSPPGEFIFASGKQYSVRDFVSGVFTELGLIWTDYVEQNPAVLGKNSQNLGRASTDKLSQAIDWNPDFSLERLVKTLLTQNGKSD